MGVQWLMPLYDPLTRLFGAGRLHDRLLDDAGVRSGETVLEIGCGTGNLLTALARRTPGVDAIGIDPDAYALRRARRKGRGLPVRYEKAFAGDVPLPAGHVDVVLSALMLHHLDETGRRDAVREAWRVLRPGGRLHIADLTGHARSGDLSPGLLTDAGFAAAVARPGRLSRIGTFVLLSGVRPD